MTDAAVCDERLSQATQASRGAERILYPIAGKLAFSTPSQSVRHAFVSRRQPTFSRCS
jgi:hypothetical protein